MNGTWFPWSEGVNGNRGGRIRHSLAPRPRHLHRGRREPTSPGSGPPTSTTTTTSPGSAADYPGDAYVDWTGLDGYNWGTNPVKPSGWKSFDQIYSSTYRYIIETVAPSKPMTIGEVASSEYGGSKAAWIKNMLTALPTEYPKIRALLWFDKYDDGMDWPIESLDRSHRRPLRRHPNAAYTGSLYRDLGGSAIQPPS